GVKNTNNQDVSTYVGNDITHPAVFAQVYYALVAGLTSTCANVVVANIPNVLNVPYFTTVPHNPIPLDAQTAGGVNMGFAQYNNGLQLALANGLITEAETAERTISFSEGQNAVLIEDEYLTNLDMLGLPPYRH